MLQQLKPLPMDTRGRAIRTSCVRERGLLLAWPKWTPSSSASHRAAASDPDRRVRRAHVSCPEVVLGLSRDCRAAADALAMPAAEGRQRRRRGRRGGRRQPRDAAGRHGHIRLIVAKVVLWTVLFAIFRHLNRLI